MAKKKTETASLIETFAEFKEDKNIDITTMMGVLEESFRSVIAKLFGSDENFDVIVNPEKGDCEIYRNRTVVADDEVTDSNKQIALSAAREIAPDYEVGEDVAEEIHFADFGRRAILTLRQTLASKILELEHDALYNKYKDRVGQLISAEVYQTWKSETLLMDDDKNELYLPKSQQIPRDFFHKGDTVTAVIDRVDNTNGNPKIYLSRTAPAFLQRLLENEIPEVGEGLIRICRIARIPGERAKIAVESYDDRIDPVGACVGVKGSRIHGVVRELHNENIDVINFTNNTALFIQRALNITELASHLEGTCYVTRQSVESVPSIRKAKAAIRKAFEASMAGKGSSLVEIVSTCNSGWKLSPVKANEWMKEHMFEKYVKGDLKNTLDK